MRPTIITFFALLLGTGCTIPERTYHGIKAARLRSEAIPVSALDTAIKVVEQSNPGTRQTDEKVVVIARAPGEGILAPNTEPWMAPTAQMARPLPDRTRQFLETVGLQALSHAGYRSANRTILPEVEKEKSLPTGRLQSKDLALLFQPTHLLILTLNRCEATPERYKWVGFVWNQAYQKDLGTRVRVHLTAELVSARTSESAWAATATLDALFRGTPTDEQLLEAVARQLVSRLPSVSVQPQPVQLGSKPTQLP